MAIRYWVGGAGTWDATTTTNWSTSSGGAGGASAPTTIDVVYFDANSGSGVVTLSGSPSSSLIDCTGFTGSWAGTGTLTLNSDLVFPAGTLNASSYTGTINITSSCSFGGGNGTFGGNINCNPGTSLTVKIFNLGSVLTVNGTVTVTSGILDMTAGTFNAGSLVTANNANTKFISLKNSTFTGNIDISIGSGTVNFTHSIGWTITLSGSTSSIATKGVTFYDIAFTNNAAGIRSITGVNSFNSISITGRSTSGLSYFYFYNNQTIGTLSVAAGAAAYCRTWLLSSLRSTVITLSCTTATALTDVDFQNINISGTTLSGTRLGNVGGNTNISFPAAKTVYFAGTTTFATATAWATTSGGVGASANFPLAQDTAIFDNTKPSAAGNVTVAAECNVGTIDFFSRTTAMTFTIFSASTPLRITRGLYLGSGLTWASNGALSLGDGTYTGYLYLDPAGKSIQCPITVDLLPSGYVQLYGALSANQSITLNSGGFWDTGYSVTCGGFISTSTTYTRTILVQGTLTINGTAQWNVAATNLTVSVNTINMTYSSGSKTFTGAGIQTYLTLNNGSTTSLTISGSNKFTTMNNTASTVGATTITFTSGTTNEFTSAFNVTGTIGKVCTLGATTTSQATLKKPGSWLMGANSTDAGNNTGLSFTGGGGIDYLTVSWINGTTSGTIYASTITETATSADSILAAVMFLSSIAETGTGTDQVAAVMTFASNASETGTATDSILTNTITYNNVSETGTGTDVIGAAAGWGSAVSETSSAADTTSAVVGFASNIAETSSAADQIVVGGTFGAIASETATGTDAINTTGTFFVSVSETSASSDAIAALASMLSSVSETATGSDTTAARMAFASAIAETATGTDQFSSSFAFFVFVSETSTGSDAINAVMAFGPVILETAASTDAINAGGTFNPAIAETGLATDQPQPTLIMPVAVTETGTVTDQISGGLLYVISINETASATDQNITTANIYALVTDLSSGTDGISARCVFVPLVQENSSAADTTSVAATFTPSVVELVTGTDNIVGGIFYSSSVAESATAYDMILAAFLWNLVNDAQSGSGWSNVNNASGAGWGNVDDSQTPGWQNT